MEWLHLNRPSNLILLLTGRFAPEALIQQADLVTRNESHQAPYEQGITAQPGKSFSKACFLIH